MLIRKEPDSVYVQLVFLGSQQLGRWARLRRDRRFDGGIWLACNSCLTELGGGDATDAQHLKSVIEQMRRIETAKGCTSCGAHLPVATMRANNGPALIPESFLRPARPA
jgi:hypothetical protein